MISPMAADDRYSAMEKSMRASGSMVVWKVKEFFSRKTEHPIQESGLAIFNMVLASKNGRMGHSMTEAFRMVTKKVMEK